MTEHPGILAAGHRPLRGTVLGLTTMAGPTPFLTDSTVMAHSRLCPRRRGVLRLGNLFRRPANVGSPLPFHDSKVITMILIAETTPTGLA